jgi:methyl-accepting chemotaxis protein
MILKKSIMNRFIVSVFIVLLIGQSIGTFVIFIQTKAALLDSLETRIQRTAVMTADMSVKPILNNDYSLIDSFVAEIIRDEDISSIHIFDGTGKVLREVIKSEDEAYRTLNPFLDQTVKIVKMPIVSEGEKIGNVKIDYSPRSMNEKMTRSMIIIALFQCIMFVGVGIVLVILFGRSIKKPVLELNQAIEKITLGDITTDIPYLGDDEIGSIAKGISFLTERLNAIVSKLNNTTVNVSMAIKQVDVLFKNALQSIKRQSSSVRELLKSVDDANKAQSEILNNTEKLASFSSENVSSLLEMKATAEEIASHTSRLYKATEASYAAVVEINQSAKSQTEHSREVVSAIEDTSASVEEIGASVREVEDHAAESAKLAERVKEITSDTGMMAVVNAVEGMEKISSEVNKSVEIVMRLGTRSADIEKVLSVIKDVTEKTNLLSLNAAILAAQAGEYGKSFSVVAEEISALSDRTASSTREISGIVKTIQGDIKDAVRSIDNAKNKVEEGNSLVLKVGEALKEALSGAEQSTEMTHAIERATEEQSAGLRQITDAVEDIRKMMKTVTLAIGEEEKSLSHLLESFGEIKEVADISKRGTEEQASGTRNISKNLELANDRISQINMSSLSQKNSNEEMIKAMNQIDGIGQGLVNDMEDVAISLNTLSAEIEVLRKEMEVFKIK